MVTSGVVPGIVMFKLLAISPNLDTLENAAIDTNWMNFNFAPIQLLGLLLTLGACYRLAKFNIDTRQSESFIGLPTPAMSLFIISLPLIQEYSTIESIQNLISNHYFLILVTVLLTYLMNAELPLFSLKFKEYSVKNNAVKYMFILISVLLIFSLHVISIPIIIFLYVSLSIIRKIYNMK